MYLPSHFTEQRPAVLHALVRAHPFATFVCHAGGELCVNHLPFLLDADTGEQGVLRGHVARANPLWRLLAEGAPSVAVFHGPQAYVSPNWYASKRGHGKVVPTWNYAVVHAHGPSRAIEDAGWLLDLVTALTDSHEAAQPSPWKVTDAPADFVARNVEMIVGVELRIERLVGKWKVSQNRPPADRRGVAEAMAAMDSDEARAMAALVAGGGRPARPEEGP